MSDTPRPTAQQLARYADEFSASSAMKLFGVRLSFPSHDRVVAEINPVRNEHRGGLGAEAVNGGVLAAMFDLAIGCTPALLDATRRNATVQLSMSFMKPVMGNSLRAEAWIDSAGATTVFSSAHILDEKGQVCARCQGVVKLSRLKWKNGSSPAAT